MSVELDKTGAKASASYRLFGGKKTSVETYAEATNGWNKWAPRVVGGFRVRF